MDSKAMSDIQLYVSDRDIFRLDVAACLVQGSSGLDDSVLSSLDCSFEIWRDAEAMFEVSRNNFLSDWEATESWSKFLESSQSLG